MQNQGSTPSALVASDRLILLRAFAKAASDGTDIIRHPAVQEVAAYAAEAAYAHGDLAGARPVSLYAAGTEHLRLGETHLLELADLDQLLRGQADDVHPKGEGLVIAPGSTKNGGRKDSDCAEIGWLFLDCDATGDWLALIEWLRAHGAAAILYRSTSHKPALPKWRLGFPLRQCWIPPSDLLAARARWKRELYPAARGVFGALAGLSGVGFDPATDALLQRFYPGHRRPEDAHEPPREVFRLDGLALDLEALYAALDSLGVAPKAKTPTGGSGPRTGAHAVAGAPTGEEAALLRAMRHAGWVGRQLAADRFAVLCPWRNDHTSGSDYDTSTVMWANGNFHCSHAHCVGRHARDVVQALPLTARILYESLRGKTAGLQRLKEQLRSTSARLASEHCRLEAEEFQRLVYEGVVYAKEGLVVFRGPPGVGKTRAASRGIAYRQNGIYASRTHCLGDEVADHLKTIGLKYRRHRGVLSIKDEDGRPVCAYFKIAEDVQRAGGSVPMLMCRKCDRRSTCEAVQPLGPKTGIDIGPHVMLPRMIEGGAEAIREGRCPTSDELVVIDEGVDPVEKRSITLQDLFEAEEELKRGRPLLIPWFDALRLEPLIGILRLFVANSSAGLDAAAEAFGRTVDPLLVRLGLFRPQAPLRSVLTRASETEDFTVFEGAVNATSLADDALRRRVTLLLRVLRVAKIFAHDPSKAVVKDFRLHVVCLTPAGEVIKTHRRVIMLDATAPVEQIKKMRPDVTVVEPAIVEHVTPRRMIVYRSRVGRRALSPCGAPDWTNAGPILIDVLARVRAAGVRRLLLVMYKALADATSGCPTVAVALDEWRAEGREIDIRWFGGVRGLNDWESWDGCATVGDPYMNLDQHEQVARFFGLDDEEIERDYRQTAAAELEQVHGRLRDVRRTDAPWHLHVGAVAPGGWGNETEVVTLPRGRPAKTSSTSPAEIQEAVARLGGCRAAARAIGIGRTTLGRYLNGERAASPEILERLLAAAARPGSAPAAPPPGPETLHDHVLAFSGPPEHPVPCTWVAPRRLT